MRVFAVLAVLLLGAHSQAETLREFLAKAATSPKAFSRAELDEEVTGLTLKHENWLYAAYLNPKTETVSGYPHLLRFNASTGAMLRDTVPAADRMEMLGSFEEMRFLDKYLLVTMLVSPSAGITFVVTPDLTPVTTIDTFAAHRIAQDRAVYIENMIHFAPAHPERLAFIELRTGNKTELFPPKDDPLRAAFARENCRHLPPADVCQANNDPCRPGLYDETISFLGSDGHGAFGLAVQRDAEHARTANGETQNVATDAALYLYAPSGDRWVYCEQPLSLAEVQALAASHNDSHEKVKDRCAPRLRVEPDLSNADFSSFR